MDTVKIKANGHTRLIAHRGLSGLERENTCAAFVAAGNRSYYGMETDLHPTLDGQFILIHDSETGRVALEDIPVEKSTLAALRALPMTDLDGNVRADLQLPLPEEYLRICRKYNKVAVLELKGDFSKEALSRIRQLVRTCHDEAKTVYISFYYDTLLNLRELSQEANIQFLFGSTTEQQLEDMAARNISVDAQWAFLTPERIAQMHRMGMEVNCWTVDDPAAALQLMDWGVDYITTNILEFEP